MAALLKSPNKWVSKVFQEDFYLKKCDKVTQKNENKNTKDNIHIHMHDIIPMKLYIKPCIGKFYSFVFIITVTLNKLFSS